MANLAHYGDQWESLRLLLGALDERYSLLSFYRKTTILHLIRSLQQFGQGQFHFFYDGFASHDSRVSAQFGELGYTSPFPGLNLSSEFGPENVLAATIARISEDITTIQLAAEQRMWHVQIAGERRTLATTYAELLQVTDFLAADALWLPPDRTGMLNSVGLHSEPGPAPDPDPDVVDPPEDFDGDFQVNTVLTYLTHSLHVRVYPYARVAVVGVPYTCFTDVKGFLAIPHELGHYRFWYSKPRQILGADGVTRTMYANIREEAFGFEPIDLKGADRWIEEIFADVYGAIIGGPLAALDAIQRALQQPSHVFTDFDADVPHPTPILRPLIYLKAIANYGSYDEAAAPVAARTTAATQLLNHWLDILGPTGLLARGAQLITSSIGLDASVNAGVPNHPVDYLIDIALRALADNSLDSRSIPRLLGWGWSNPMSLLTAGKDITTPDSQRSLVEDFKVFIMDSRFVRSSVDLDALRSFNDPLDGAPTNWRDWALDAKQYLQNVGAGGAFALTQTGNLAAGVLPGDMKLELRPGAKWLPVYGAGGWTTEGPCSTRR